MALDEGELAGLYAAPLDRFVAERTALARRLRDEGRRDDAREAQGLRKPSAALWAANWLAREHGGDVRRLADAAARLAKGDGGADGDFRTALRALAGRVPEALEAAGRKPSGSAADGVVELLRAAAADPEARERLVDGRLLEEPEPAGFAAMAGARPAAPARRERPKREDERKLAEARAVLSEARANARDLRRRADDAEREAKRAGAEADRAEGEVEKAERALDRLRRRG